MPLMPLADIDIDITIILLMISVMHYAAMPLIRFHFDAIDTDAPSMPSYAVRHWLITPTILHYADAAEITIIFHYLRQPFSLLMMPLLIRFHFEPFFAAIDYITLAITPLAYYWMITYYAYWSWNHYRYAGSLQTEPGASQPADASCRAELLPAWCQ